MPSHLIHLTAWFTVSAGLWFHTKFPVGTSGNQSQDGHNFSENPAVQICKLSGDKEKFFLARKEFVKDWICVACIIVFRYVEGNFVIVLRERIRSTNIYKQYRTITVVCCVGNGQTTPPLVTRPNVYLCTLTAFLGIIVNGFNETLWWLWCVCSRTC